jgi:hypothetical protein
VPPIKPDDAFDEISQMNHTIGVAFRTAGENHPLETAWKI